MLTEIEEKFKHFRGLDSLLTGMEETSLVHYKTSDMCAQVQPDSAEVSLLDKAWNEPVHGVHNGIADINTISDTASPQLFPKA